MLLFVLRLCSKAVEPLTGHSQSPAASPADRGRAAPASLTAAAGQTPTHSSAVCPSGHTSTVPAGEEGSYLHTPRLFCCLLLHFFYLLTRYLTVMEKMRLSAETVCPVVGIQGFVHCPFTHVAGLCVCLGSLCSCECVPDSGCVSEAAAP